jgi:hypothetical protein
MHCGIYRVEWLSKKMPWCKKNHVNIYRDKPRPKWQSWCTYTFGLIAIAFISFWMLRDTAPVKINNPIPDDLEKNPGSIVGSHQLNDVHWRMKIRHVNTHLVEECKTSNYTIFTQKNLELDEQSMEESYIHMCKPSMSVVNARAVFSGASNNYVTCQEQYAGITKKKERKYPFSLKYISGTTFMAETKVIRQPKDACMWLHAIDIVESHWD